jgi:RNA polymerase sigma-32 factor
MSTNLMSIDFASPINSLDAYIYRVSRVPFLTAEEEYNYSKEFLENEDLDSAKQLVLAHLRYVVRVARGYSGYGLPLGDLIQEGNLGLMKAVKRFNPDVGVRLVSFAVHWIKAEIHEYVLRNWRIVKIATTKAQRKLFFNLRKMKTRLGWFTQAEVQQVATDLGVSCKDVLAMEARLNAMDMSYDLPEQSSSESSFAPAQYLTTGEDPAEIVQKNQQQTQTHAALEQALASLDTRSREILQARWLSEKKITLKDLADKYCVSAERIRQLEATAIKKMKAQFN